MRYTVTLLLTAALLMAADLQAQSAKEWRAELDSINKLIRQNPSSTDHRLKKAAINIYLGQWDYAAEEYGQVLRLDPDNLAALYFRAYANTHLREYGLALADYEQFLAISPKHFEARLGLATVKEKIGRHSEASDEYNRIVQMFPDSAAAWAARAMFETERKQTEVALYDWEEAIRRDPLNADYVASQAELLLALGRKKEAQAMLQAAIKRGIPKGLLLKWLK